jgi:hypothetical protein
MVNYGRRKFYRIGPWVDLSASDFFEYVEVVSPKEEILSCSIVLVECFKVIRSITSQTKLDLSVCPCRTLLEGD